MWLILTDVLVFRKQVLVFIVDSRH